MLPIHIDIFFPVPEGWGLCTSCEMMISQANLDKASIERGLDEYPPEWQEEFKRLSSFVFSLADRYQDKVLIRIWDPRSFQGLLKSIRYGVRRYPTFVVNGKSKFTGWQNDELDQFIHSIEEIHQF